MANRHMAESARNAQAGAILLVVHEFQARSSDELSLAKGDRIELIERDDDFGDGWYLGRHLQNGNTGLFPEVYTTCAPKGTLMTSQNQRAGPPSNRPSDSTNAISSNAAGNVPTPTQLPIQPQSAPPFGTTHHLPPTQSQIATPAPQYFTQSANNSPTAVTHARPTSNTAPSSVVSTPILSHSNQLQSGQRSSTSNSTVMNETLSVIDEHITDMRKPGRSRSPRDRRFTSDSVSDYGQMLNVDRASYIHGTETEEEESSGHTEKEVKTWSPAKVAEYLEDAGVEKKHCEVFKEQEFSGEVLLGMDQSSIFLKELDLGPIGRRLRTWQKIRALQDEVKPPRPSQTRKISESSQPSSRRGSTQARVGQDALEGHIVQQHQPQAQTGRPESGSALGAISSSARQSPRPSAASVRNLGYSAHSRRHSSLDQTTVSSGASTPQTAPVPTGHNKQPSFDRNWNMSNLSGQPNGSARPVSSTYMRSAASTEHVPLTKRESDLTVDTSGDPDRGYVSSGDTDARRERRVLRKTGAGGNDHYRASSYETGGKRMSFFRKSSRASSPARSLDIGGPIAGSFVQTVSGTHTPNGSQISAAQAHAPENSSQMTDSPQSLEAPQRAGGVGDQATSPRRGLRAISDAVTGKEKALHSMWAEKVTPSEETLTHSPGSSTPSGASKSIELDDANQSRYATPIGVPSVKRRGKKNTSAYVRGLEQKSPQQQMLGCDFSGWMKKKSSNLMTNWKPRLFVLRGRRLSYYYSENDTEEKGLIDISGHRVLPADNERLTGLHASLTKATSSPNSPHGLNSATWSAASNSPTTPGAPGGLDSEATSPTLTSAGKNEGFIFKLVPPRSGFSRQINFTKPMVHYFAVPSVEVGRLWMAALMKATIDRDESVEVVTTYQQKTISLAKARARKERPPALMGLDEEVEADDTQTVSGTTELDSNTERATQEQASEATDDVQPPSEGKPEMAPYMAPTAQITEVTDLENVVSPRSSTQASPGGGKRSIFRTSAGKRIGSNSSNDAGLGIQGLQGKSEHTSPIVDQMQKAGMW